MSTLAYAESKSNSIVVRINVTNVHKKPPRSKWLVFLVATVALLTYIGYMPFPMWSQSPLVSGIGGTIVVDAGVSDSGIDSAEVGSGGSRVVDARAQ
jgi:hypothetical protein